MRAFALVLALTASLLASRARLLPYPAPGKVNSSTLYVLEDSVLNDAEQLAVSTIQGVTSRTQGLVYRNSTGGTALWIDELQRTWGVVPHPVGSLAELLTLTAHALSGYVITNTSDGDAVLASVTACSLLGAVALDATLVPQAKAAGLPEVYDARGNTTADVIRLLNGTGGRALSTSVAVLQDPTKLCCMWDYAVFAGAATWFDGTMAGATSTRILDSMQPSWALLGWGTSEQATVSATSTRAGWVNAADWARNLGLLSTFRVEGDIVQPNAPPPAPAPPARRHTVSFLMTDGDNVQWLLNNFATGTEWWSNPNRGSIPMGWTISAALPDLAPAVSTRLYRQATRRAGPGSACDVFVAGPSGAGYAYPDLMGPTELADFAASTTEAARRSGLRLLNVMGDRYDTASAAAMAGTGTDGIFWYNYSPYDGLHGNITFVGDVPVIGARAMLWVGRDTPETLAAKLRAASTDPSSPDAYSLVVVHAWSSNVTQVAQTIELLKGDAVDAVCPDELVARVTANIAR